MSDATHAADDVTVLIDGLETIADRLATGLVDRYHALGDAGEQLDQVPAALAAGGTSGSLLLFEVVAIAAIVTAVFVLVNRRLAGWRQGGGVWRRLLLSLLEAAIAIAIGFVVARVIAAPGLPIRTLRQWTVVTVAGFVLIAAVRAILLGSRDRDVPHRSKRLLAMVHDFSISIGLAIVGTGIAATLKTWNVGPGLADLVRTALVIPIYLVFGLAVWRNRKTMATIVAGRRPRGRMRSKLARIWPGLVLTFLIVTFLSTQAAATMGSSLRGSTVLLTTLLFLLAPHLDAAIGRWALAGLESNRIPIAAAAARQTARFTIIVALVAMLGALWAAPLAAAFGIDFTIVTRDAFGVALIALAAAYLWNVIGTVSARALAAEVSADADHPDAMAAPRSRLGTLVPLLSTVGKSSIALLAGLSILVSLGINVWPLITGLSVFGLAIGFGSQTLVKDIVSGLFFLIDDAFRHGEYIESSGAKGTVEKISVRSVSLRNSRGALATVPYGQIGKIQNFSRDWVIEKMAFRVAFDTDVEKVRKIFKKIGQDIAADPELAPDLLEPFKSQGIADVEDGTLVIRAKFKARAGKQSMIRRAALIAVHKAFLENGIKAVPKPLSGGQPAA
ncbi:MAG: mechanosensitive ion channel family protein [Rhizobiaceae bacterium]|nr:mechanosensitive ion channel family protein [Rhizobiaceae bacterium]